MTDELGSSARALLDAARDGLSPDAAAIQRMRSKIDLAVGGAAAGGAAAATGSSLAAKLGIVAVVAAVATGGYLLATRDRGSARPVVPVTAPAPAKVAAPAPSTAPAPVIVATEEPAPIKPVVKARPVARATTLPAKSAEVVLAPDEITSKRKPVDLAREVELVDRAMAALRRGDARAALVALRTYETETAGAGQLAEDAAAIEIEALCKLSDPAVPTKLATFDKRWPESAQRSRLTTRCP